MIGFTVNFGINMVPVHPADLASVARSAEELGFESLWLGEHVVTPVTLTHAYPGGDGTPPFAPNSRFLDPFTALSHLAAHTRTIRLGTGVLVAPLHSPLGLARTIATVDVLSGGRLSVGVGVGWMREEFAVEGMSFADRGRRTDDLLTILDALFGNEIAGFSSERYTLPEMGFEPKPLQKPRPPVFVGGASPAALARTAAFGDGWYGGQQPPDRVAEILTDIHHRREELGRADLPFETTVLTGWSTPFDARLIERYREVGVDRVVVTPWARSRHAQAAIEQFADAAALTTPALATP
ncbi:LLM class F420-dependent oxidoreductase [Rhodococcus opacus]|uniref:LLM class F420-dependent oxidoreductase n=1 Tax=Rhodococcus opacus TaxID=37919 RepID=UPI001C458D44|nr:LLM class F420-dependent oxidoreductase [Rhodococcus opacus]MBV6756200.1 LLM class F420-dependent oxidoreductase [Rhodococcus opacus]